MYCLPVWGHCIKSINDILYKLQCRTLRILFQCYRTGDAWRYTDNNILTIFRLYKHEVTKLCYKHQTQQLPEVFNLSNMPETNAENTLYYDMRKLHSHYKYNYCTNTKNPFINNCITLWNNLPLNLRSIPYSNDRSINNYHNFSRV